MPPPSSPACSKAASGSWSGRTRGVPETAIPSGRIITARTARFAPAPISAAPMRPEPRAGGWCRPASSARSTISTSRAWSRIPGSGAATPRSSTIPPPACCTTRRWESASGVWAVASRGWVQESWPRAMKDACPDLALPADLPVNEKQTSTAFDKAIAQDLDAPAAGLSGLRTARTGSDRHRGLGGPCNPAGGGAQALPRR